MLESISLKFTEVQDLVIIPTQGVTIFVGPNNSGKSLVLRELEQDFASNSRTATKIVADFEIVWLDDQQVATDITNLTKKAPLGISPDHVYVGRFTPAGILEAHTVSLEPITQFIKQRINKRWITSQFLRFFLIRLDGRTRFELTNDRPRGDLLGQAQNMLMHLFKDEEARKRVRDIVYDAFGVYFTIEQLSAENLRIRLSQIEPDSDEQNWNDAARTFHGRALHIKEASDGIQAFVGIVCAVLSGDYRALLIDEPEAFLHPPLARKLGYQLTTVISKSGGSLLASTHSPDFLIGCIQASTSVRVVRLEYSNGKSKGRIVDPAVISSMFKTPLLRSANVISGLFHDGVVVTESDNDRAFYSEIYHRLNEQEKGYPSILFVNAQGKHTISDIIKPLRQLGIPAAAIVDVDVLEEGGTTWSKWLSAGHLPSGMHLALGQQRADIHDAAKKSGTKKMKAEGGIYALPTPYKDAAEELCNLLDQYGIFVVRSGELEKWLPNLRPEGLKTDWVISIFEKMGADPTSTAYLRPTSDDVWGFIRKIIAWVQDSSRKGIA